MKAKNEAGFWRRLAALWIDLFVTWSVTELFMTLLSLIAFRIAFETVFILTGACYATVMLGMIIQRNIWLPTVSAILVGKLWLQVMEPENNMV